MDIKLDELKLLRGKEILIDGVGILKPITINEITEIGEKNFYQYLNNLCFNIDDLNATEEQRENFLNNNITTFQIILSVCLHDLEYLQLIIKSLKFFFKEDVCFVKSLGVFFLNEFNEYRFISEKNFEDIKTIIRLQNGLSKNDILDENPKDERTKILLEKRRKAREKLEKAKSKNNNSDSEPLTFADLVSIMCANANGVNHENVWNMNFYMFQNQFQRMKLIDDYDISIRSLLAGANSDETDFKHYMSHL
jgi:hypothetical protein